MAIRLARIRPYQRYDHFCQIRGSVTFTVSELWSLLPFWSSHESDGTKSLPPLRSGRNFASEWSRKFGKSPVYFFYKLAAAFDQNFEEVQGHEEIELVFFRINSMRYAAVSSSITSKTMDLVNPPGHGQKTPKPL